MPPGDEPVDLFFSRATKLGPRLGPVLYQLPPRWTVDDSGGHSPTDAVRLREAITARLGSLLNPLNTKDTKDTKVHEENSYKI